MIMLPDVTEHVGRLTFQILVLLAHNPHADLFIDQVDTGEAGSEMG